MFKGLKHKLNIYRRYRYWKMADCIFIHIPKVAGTSINHALYNRTLGHYRAEEIKKCFPKFYEKSFNFSFVRDPWQRLASAYRFAKLGRTETMGISNPKQYQIKQFDTFERFVLEWLPEQNLLEVDFVFQPQYNFVTDREGKLIVDFVGKLERFSNDIQVVESNLGRKIEIRRLNASKRPNKANGLYSEYTNPKMVDVVSQVYARDIELFGYEFRD